MNAIAQRGMQVPGPLQSIWIIAYTISSNCNRLKYNNRIKSFWYSTTSGLILIISHSACTIAINVVQIEVIYDWPTSLLRYIFMNWAECLTLVALCSKIYFWSESVNQQQAEVKIQTVRYILYFGSQVYNCKRFKKKSIKKMIP